MTTLHLRHWDIFCRVVDNFGDCGVSWRLARQLASEHGVKVRLWIDHIASLQALCPAVDSNASHQIVEGVEICQYSDASVFPKPADVVIEAFGCGLPQAYVNAMAARESRPLWIVLEYLSAELWVRDHHGLPSPHPRLDLPRYFFFPGFAEGTGGVLRESELLARRDAFDRRARCEWWLHAGFEEVPQDTLAVSLFAYAHAPYQALLEACAQGAAPVVVAIPEGPLALRVRDDFHAGAGKLHRAGNLELRFVPFVPQAHYDNLLWACDINFVRGEDSFVRAQWAGQPLVWHIYPQQADAHVIKLNAFLDAYCDSMPVSAARAVRALWGAWNGVGDAPPVTDAWRNFIDAREAQLTRLRSWQERLVHIGDATGNLLKFCQKMI